MLITNTYSNNTFFVAQMEYPNFSTEFSAPAERKSHKVLQAKDMAFSLTENNIHEQFEVDKKSLKEIFIVEAMGVVTMEKSPEYPYSKRLLKIDGEILNARRPAIFEPVLIVQGIVFDKFFTDAFFMASYDEVVSFMDHRGITTLRPAQLIYSRIIENIKINQ